MSLETLLASLQAVVSDLSPAPEMQQYCRGTAQGLLLQALAPLLRHAEPELPPAVARLLQVSRVSKQAGVKTNLVTHLGVEENMEVHRARSPVRGCVWAAGSLPECCKEFTGSDRTDCRLA